MKSEFTAEFFRGNRERLRSLFVGTAPIVLSANGLMQRNSDISYPFRQDSSFWYLTGVDEAEVVLVMDKDKEYLIIPEQTDYQSIFDGSINIESLKTVSGIETVFAAKEGWKQLKSRLSRVKHVATLAPAQPYLETYGMFTNPARRQLVNRLEEISPGVELLDLRPHLVRMRSVKQPQELVAIKQAIKLTAGAIKRAHRRLGGFTNECQVEADITHYFLSHGAKNAWQPTIAAGENATTLHYTDNNGPLIPGQLVYCDVGAEVSHYAADITRTFSIGGKPTKRQQAVLEAVVEVQSYAASELKTGVIIKEYEKKIEHFMGEKLRELGLIKTIKRETVRQYFSHATSHFLGLDAHDLGDYDQPLEPGMVLTIEPGIYIPKEAIGVRIEDDVLITESGLEILSDALPRVLDSPTMDTNV